MAATHIEPYPDPRLARAARRSGRRVDPRQEQRLDHRRGPCGAADRLGDGRRSPRRTGRALARRTVRDPGSHPRGDDHRAVADRLADADRGTEPQPRPRHGSCGGHARAQRPCRNLHRGRHAASSRAGVPDARGERVPRGADADGRAGPGAAQLHAGDAGPLLLEAATDLRRQHLLRAVPGVPVRADGASPGLLRADGCGSRPSMPTRPRRASARSAADCWCCRWSR